MITLGLMAGVNSTAALMVDGEIVACQKIPGNILSKSGEVYLFELNIKCLQAIRAQTKVRKCVL